MIFHPRKRYYEMNHIVRWKLGHYRSLLNRGQTIETYIKTHRTRKLQVGCWPYLLNGWLNSDLYGNKDMIPLNLLQPFPIPNETFNYIFSEHTQEHFTLEQGHQMLSEFYRILRKGGKVRISTPDLAFLIKLYSSKKTATQKKYLKWSADTFFKDLGRYEDGYVINNFVRAWGHQFIYDFTTLKQQLEAVGFKNVKRYSPGKSKDKNLTGIEHHGKSTGEEFNKLESLVVEATKL